MLCVVVLIVLCVACCVGSSNVHIAWMAEQGAVRCVLGCSAGSGLGCVENHRWKMDLTNIKVLEWFCGVAHESGSVGESALQDNFQQVGVGVSWDQVESALARCVMVGWLTVANSVHDVRVWGVTEQGGLALMANQGQDQEDVVVQVVDTEQVQGDGVRNVMRHPVDVAAHHESLRAELVGMQGSLARCVDACDGLKTEHEAFLIGEEIQLWGSKIVGCVQAFKRAVQLSAGDE